MVTRAQVVNINNMGTYNKYTLYVPIFEKTRGTSNRLKIDVPSVDAMVNFCIPGSYQLNLGDMVFVTYEDTSFEDPVILGILRKSESNSNLKLNLRNIDVESSVVLPKNTVIGEIDYGTLENIQGLRQNVVEQLNYIKNNLKNIHSKIIDFDTRIKNVSIKQENERNETDKNLERLENIYEKIGKYVDTDISKEETAFGELSDLSKKLESLKGKISLLNSKVWEVLKIIGEVPEGMSLTDIISELFSRVRVLQDTPVESTVTETISNDKSFESLLMKLKVKYPEGMYWNREYNGAKNNADGYTDKGCAPGHASRIGTSIMSCNYYTNTSGIPFGTQCYGFALQCAHDLTGSDSSQWECKRGLDSLTELKVGDIIRYKFDGHSVLVIGVNGDTIKIAECNWDGKCGVSYKRTLSLSSDIKPSFTYVRKRPCDFSNTTLG